MKSLVFIMMVLTMPSLVAAQINAAEYFMDSDPGIGNGMPLSVSGNTIDQGVNIPTSGLADGTHKLYVRVQNIDGNWSLYGHRTFYVNPMQTNTANIASAEYFFDVDPGPGNGTALSMNGGSVDQNYSIATTGLSEGTHKLYVRVTSTDGSWSLYDQNLFYINPYQTNLSDISAAEYFIDSDPGQGNGTAISVSGGSIDQNLTVPTSGLGDGIHVLYIRVANTNSDWSLYDRNIFYIGQNNTALLTAAEYFFDIDPGFGNGYPVDLNATENLDEDLVFQVPTDLPDGDHFLYVRVQNTDGTWSLYAPSDMFSTLAVNEVFAHEFQYYPNPVEDQLFLDTNQREILEFKLMDTTGKVVMDVVPLNFQVDLSRLDSGVYLFYLKTIDGRISKKIVKQ